MASHQSMTLNSLEVDTDDTKRLTKCLYAQKKRKGAAPGGSSKRMKVGSLSSKVLDVLATAPKVVLGTKVPSIIEGSVEGAGSQPLASSILPAGGSMSEPPTKRERGDGDDKKKKKAVVMKMAHKARSGRSSNSDSDDLGVVPFDNPNIIQDLSDKFALPKESGHHILAHLKRINRQEVEALKVQGDLQAKIDCLQEKVAEAKHLTEEKSPIDVEQLPQGIPLRSIVRNLKKEVHHLRKKLKRTKDELQKSRKNALEVIIEVTRVRKLQIKDSTTFTIKKGSFERKLVELKKSNSDKS
ncbi:hypothetical protein COCNU_scaffold000575G000020 [Cocos nucifera]|nr:hypothetical protein [Cocos nucifera]